MNEQLAPHAVASSIGIEFTGRRSDFRRLAIRGGLLELVTVGFYRFWLATDMRRHLWSHTSVDGDAAEYTGTGKELLIGFFFALAILAPIYLGYFLLGLEAERLKAFASLPLGLFFYLFTQFAVYRARRYRLTRTVWRGVRFWMSGSGWSYAWRAGLWGLLVAVTFGLALPWEKAALERYKMRHTSYGDLAGRFEASGGALFKRGWWLWLVSWLLVLVPVIVPLVMARLGLLTASQLDIKNISSSWMYVASAYVLPWLVILTAPFVYGAWKAIEWRWWVSGLRFGEVEFASHLRGGALIGLYWKVIGWSLLLLIALSAAFGAVFGIAYAMSPIPAANAQKVLLVSQEPGVIAALVLIYVVTALALGVVMRIYLMRDLWQRVATSVTAHNLAAADQVVARGDLVSALGEGFADSLDVVGF